MTARRRTSQLAGCLAILLALALVPRVVAQSTDPNANVGPFDFSNGFYAENGVNVTPLDGPGGRVGVTPTGTLCTPGTTGCNAGGFGFPPPFPDPEGANWTPDPSNTDPVRTAARVLQTTGGFDMNGNLIYYSIMGTLNDDTFFTTQSDGTLDEAGQRAFNFANNFRAFISPQQLSAANNGKMGFNPCGATAESPASPRPCWVPSPAPPNRRQDNVFDTQNTYFCQNLLGLWRLVFSTYTQQAFNQSGQFASAASQAVLGPLGNLNGTNLDGTPVLERTAEFDGLTGLGYMQQSDMPHQPHGGAPRYVV